MFITMPQLGETVTEGTIVRWCKAVGDVVAEDEPLFEVSTDKVDTEVPSAVAATLWARLVEDPSRSVRRATVDTVGDARREELRPLLETALGDADPWIRWRALRGIAQLGADASRGAVAGLAADPDFRVRLEAARTIAG